MRFDKSKFEGLTRGDTVTYDGRFVARFKYQKGNRPGFIRFLIANFEVEEYFAAYDRGHAPAIVLESKGYVPLHIARWIENGTLSTWNPSKVDISGPGYPVTLY